MNKGPTNWQSTFSQSRVIRHTSLQVSASTDRPYPDQPLTCLHESHPPSRPGGRRLRRLRRLSVEAEAPGSEPDKRQTRLAIR